MSAQPPPDAPEGLGKLPTCFQWVLGIAVVLGFVVYVLNGGYGFLSTIWQDFSHWLTTHSDPAFASDPYATAEPLPPGATPIPPGQRLQAPECSSEDTVPPCFYTVKLGDSYALIAQKFFSDQTYLRWIQNINRDAFGRYRRLYRDTRLYIPRSKEESDPAYGSCEQVIPPCYYTVQGGETYESISTRAFKNSAYAWVIRDANRDEANHVLALKEDMVIVVPVHP
jgi:hypothetical protein